MHELFPIAAGLVLGASMRQIPSSMRRQLVVALIGVIAFLAFLLSGEFLLSWGFLLIDLGGTTLAAASGNLAARSLSDRALPVRRRNREGGAHRR
jgi:hypothetical protein